MVVPSRIARSLSSGRPKAGPGGSIRATSPSPRKRGEGEENASSVQREDEQVARILEVIELHRVEVTSARLHGEILLRPDRVSDRRPLEGRTQIEAPQLLQLLVVIGDDPAVLQRREYEAAGRDGR